MKYDDKHKRDYEGAKGKCGTCGLEVTLDNKDRPYLKTWSLKAWYVRCPHCFGEIECRPEQPIKPTR